VRRAAPLDARGAYAAVEAAVKENTTFRAEPRRGRRASVAAPWTRHLTNMTVVVMAAAWLGHPWKFDPATTAMAGHRVLRWAR
jgi:hypothetical protein